MPLYIYRHPETKETVEVLQSMNDVHEYFDEEGVKWQRIFTKPHASIDTRVDCEDAVGFVNKSAAKRGSVGDVMDLSAEMSAKREERHGVDPVKKQFFEQYRKKTGKKHLADKPKRIEGKGIKIDLD